MKLFSLSLRLIVALLALSAAPVQAATLTIDIPSCTSYTLSGSTVNCVTGGSSKSCAVSGPSSGVTGGAVTLNGSCSGFSPTDTSWTGCSDSNGTSCTMSATGTATFTGSDSGTPYTASKLVTFSSPTCSITGATTGTVGSTLTLSASCNFTPTTFLWNGCDSASSASTCTISKTVAASYTVGVTASDTSGHSASSSKSVTFNAASSGSFPGSCDYSVYNRGTLIATTTKVYSSAFSDGALNFDGASYSNLNIRANSVAYATVVMGSSNQTAAFSEYGSAAVFRVVYASKVPCDMQSGSLVAASVSGKVDFVNSTQLSGVAGGKVNAKTGETWYVMIVNYALDKSRGSATYNLPVNPSSCSAGATCGMVLKTTTY